MPTTKYWEVRVVVAVDDYRCDEHANEPVLTGFDFVTIGDDAIVLDISETELLLVPAEGMKEGWSELVAKDGE
jgi:selenophosphate synthetase-related protein